MQNSRKYTFVQNKREINSKSIKFKKTWIWEVLEIDWKEVKMTLNGNEINLPTLIILPFRDKLRARKLIRKQPLLLLMMLKQGKTRFILENDNRDPNMANDNA